MTTGSGSRQNHETGSGIPRVAWTSTPANYDIRASDPTGEGRCCRRIVVGTSGTVVITDPTGTSVTLPAGLTVWDVQAATLTNASTAQNVVVIW